VAFTSARSGLLAFRASALRNPLWKCKFVAESLAKAGPIRNRFTHSPELFTRRIRI